VIILDTTHLSQLQIRGSSDAETIQARLSRLPRAESWITVISPYEQLRAALGLINSARSIDEQVVRFALLGDLLDHYATQWTGRVLPFDEAAAEIFRGFPAKLIRRIGSRDARIASIALAHDATLVTANLADFQEVPGLAVVDWLGDPDRLGPTL
jgi:tRNA(fMet)-specific endonuclease VapC